MFTVSVSNVYYIQCPVIYLYTFHEDGVLGYPFVPVSFGPNVSSNFVNKTTP